MAKIVVKKNDALPAAKAYSAIEVGESFILVSEVADPKLVYRTATEGPIELSTGASRVDIIAETLCYPVKSTLDWEYDV